MTQPLENYVRMLKRKARPPLKTIRLMEVAVQIYKDPAQLNRERERVRRHLNISATHIEKLRHFALNQLHADRVLLWSFLEVLQAASVAACSVEPRNVLAFRLSIAALQAGQNEALKAAYNDAFQGARIVQKFFPASEGDTATQDRDKLEIMVQNFNQSPPDPPPPEFYAHLIGWNSDWNATSGYLAQSDATERLAAALEAYKPDPTALWLALEKHFFEMNNAHLKVRYLITIGDAFYKINEWQLAAAVFDRIHAIHALRTGDPLHFHAIVQQAGCWLRMGDKTAASEALERIDAAKFEQLAQLVLTVRAEYTRYLAILDSLNDSQHHPEIMSLLRTISLLAHEHPKDRTQYLRTLFYKVLKNDIRQLL